MRRVVVVTRPLTPLSTQTAMLRSAPSVASMVTVEFIRLPSRLMMARVGNAPGRSRCVSPTTGTIPPVWMTASAYVPVPVPQWAPRFSDYRQLERLDEGEGEP